MAPATEQQPPYNPPVTRVRGMAVAVYWVLATPAVLPMAGWYHLIPLWLLLGVVAWVAQGWVLRRTHGKFRQRFGQGALPLSPLWMGLWWALAVGLFAMGTAMVLVLIHKTMGTFITAACLGVMALVAGWFFFGSLTGGDGWRLPPWWKVLGVVLFLYVLRTALGAWQLPNAFVGWIPSLVVFLVGAMLRVPPVLLFAAWVNATLPATLIEWYVAPMNGQPARVTAQPGVELIRHDSTLDFRWAQEGCREGEYWMGTRSMSGLSENKTTVQRNDEGFHAGGSTGDNGVVDCAMHLVMVGDFDVGGRLYVLDEHTGQTLSTSEVRQLLTSGITGLVYHPGRGWLLGAYEADPVITWLKISDPLNPQQVDLPHHATHLAFCSGTEEPCFYSAVQEGWVRKHSGADLSDVKEVKRVGRSLAPDLLLDEARQQLYVSDFRTGTIEVFHSGTLKPITTYDVPIGIRFMILSPEVERRIWAAGFMDGWLYEIDGNGFHHREIFLGHKARWLNLSRDGKTLLWCAASACYKYTPPPQTDTLPGG